MLGTVSTLSDDGQGHLVRTEREARGGSEELLSKRGTVDSIDLLFNDGPGLLRAGVLHFRIAVSLSHRLYGCRLRVSRLLLFPGLISARSR